MNCFVSILLAPIKVRIVNLTDLACTFSGTEEQDSRYKRLSKEVTIDFSIGFSLGYFGLSEEPIYLSIDRTNWL